MGRLVIDDEREARVTPRKSLEKAGYDVVEAENGQVGIVVFHEHPADLVITDLYN